LALALFTVFVTTVTTVTTVTFVKIEVINEARDRERFARFATWLRASTRLFDQIDTELLGEPVQLARVGAHGVALRILSRRRTFTHDTLLRSIEIYARLYMLRVH
jgi:hypothetical protein